MAGNSRLISVDVYIIEKNAGLKTVGKPGQRGMALNLRQSSGFFVIPAQAGIQEARKNRWSPACVGMT
jgi:hypothetical protein